MCVASGWISVLGFVHKTLTNGRTCEFFKPDTLICDVAVSTLDAVVLWEAVMRKSQEPLHLPHTLHQIQVPQASIILSLEIIVLLLP